MFTGGPKPKVEPVPTRNDAADNLDSDAERRKRLAAGYGAGTTFLSGPGGVSSEMTGTRSANA